MPMLVEVVGGANITDQAECDEGARGVPQCPCCKEPMQWVASLVKESEFDLQNDRGPPKQLLLPL